MLNDSPALVAALAALVDEGRRCTNTCRARTDMSSVRSCAAALLRLGTRGSALARWQTDFVPTCSAAAWPELVLEVVVLQTRGDRILDTPLPLIGGKGLFTARTGGGAP